MAFRYLIYSTGTTYTSTIIRESATNNPGVNEASYYTDFVIPEIQPLYLWRVDNAVTPTSVIPNTDANILAYEQATAPAPTYSDYITYGEVTGMTAGKIDTVTGATGNVPIFTAEGNIEDSGFSIPEITGLTTYTFVGSGGTQVFTDGNTITIKSTTPTGSTVNWGDISGTVSNQTDLWADLQLLSGATDNKLDITVFTGFTADTAQEFQEVYGEIDYISGVTNTKLDTSSFNAYTGATQPILNAALTGLTNLGTGTTIGGTSGRNVTLKSISGTGGISILGDGDNLIISGQTSSAAVWGNITGTLSDQDDLWQVLTGMTAETATKLDTSIFTSYTGATETRLQGIENDIIYLSGQTDLKLDTSVFTSYTGATEIRIGNLEDDVTELYNESLINITGATNGLSKSGSKDVKLGGVLTEDTTISGLSYGLTVNTQDITLQAVDGISIIDTDGGSGINIESDAGTISLVGNTNLGAERTKIEVSETLLRITDSRAVPVGLQYAADYSAAFTEESLITKRYADAIAGGLIPKAAVTVATTTGQNLDLSGVEVVDGVTTTDGMRVLVKNQTDATENGIYIASASTWTRAVDFDGNPGGEVSSGNIIPVLTGNSNHNSLWVLVTPNPITIDVTSLTFTLFASPHYSAGHGIGITGSTIYVDGSVLDGNSLVWSGGTFNVDINSGTLGTALTNINNDIDYLSGQTDTKLAISDFANYTGITEGRLQDIEDNIVYLSGQTDLKLNTSVFVSYTGATETRLQGIESDITYLSGQTDLKLDTSVFASYSATTASEINSKLDTAIFTGYTASTKNKDKKIQLVSTGTSNVNTVAATSIIWHSADPYETDIYTWTGGSSVWIDLAGTYEIQYHVTLKNSAANQTHSVGGYLIKNNAATLPITATAAMIVGPNTSGELSLPPVVLTFAAGDKLDLAAFRIGNTGTVNLVSGSVYLTINKLT